MPGFVEFSSKALMNCDYEKKKKIELIEIFNGIIQFFLFDP